MRRDVGHALVSRPARGRRRGDSDQIPPVTQPSAEVVSGRGSWGEGAGEGQAAGRDGLHGKEEVRAKGDMVTRHMKRYNVSAPVYVH